MSVHTSIGVGQPFDATTSVKQHLGPLTWSAGLRLQVYDLERRADNLTLTRVLGAASQGSWHFLLCQVTGRSGSVILAVDRRSDVESARILVVIDDTQEATGLGVDGEGNLFVACNIGTDSFRGRIERIRLGEQGQALSRNTWRVFAGRLTGLHTAGPFIYALESRSQSAILHRVVVLAGGSAGRCQALCQFGQPMIGLSLIESGVLVAAADGTSQFVPEE